MLKHRSEMVDRLRAIAPKVMRIDLNVIGFGGYALVQSGPQRTVSLFEGTTRVSFEANSVLLKALLHNWDQVEIKARQLQADAKLQASTANLQASLLRNA